MKTLALLRSLPLLLLSTPLFAAPNDACAPQGFRPPMLSRLIAEPADRLFLQADPQLAGGKALLFFEGSFGPALPLGPCTVGRTGRLIGLTVLDGEGRAQWEVPPVAAGRMDALHAMAWPLGGSWGDVHVSATVRRGNAMAADVSAFSSDVVITEIQKDPTVVSDSKGEWFEVRNLGTSPVNLEGWTVADLGSDQFQVDAGGAGLWVAPGAAFVFGREADPFLNGGIGVDYVYSGLSLANGEDELVLIDPNGGVVDQVLYEDSAWPDVPGLAMSLDPASTSAAANDDGAAWCSSTTVIGSGPDTGTPGSDNPDCQ